MASLIYRMAANTILAENKLSDT